MTILSQKREKKVEKRSATDLGHSLPDDETGDVPSDFLGSRNGIQSGRQQLSSTVIGNHEGAILPRNGCGGQALQTQHWCPRVNRIEQFDAEMPVCCC